MKMLETVTGGCFFQNRARGPEKSAISSFGRI